VQHSTIRRPRILPRRLAYSVVEETVGHPSQDDTQTAFRQPIYFPILDCIIPELDSRFSKHVTTVMIGMQALMPKYCSFLDNSKLEAFNKFNNMPSFAERMCMCVLNKQLPVEHVCANFISLTSLCLLVFTLIYPRPTLPVRNHLGGELTFSPQRLFSIYPEHCPILMRFVAQSSAGYLACSDVLHMTGCRSHNLIWRKYRK
jgi:hypothetical protein